MGLYFAKIIKNYAQKQQYLKYYSIRLIMKRLVLQYNLDLS